MDHTKRNTLVRKRALELQIRLRRLPTAEEVADSLSCENYRPDPGPHYMAPDYRAAVQFRHLRQDARIALARRILKDLGASRASRPVL